MSYYIEDNKNTHCENCNHTQLYSCCMMSLEIYLSKSIYLFSYVVKINAYISLFIEREIQKDALVRLESKKA